MPHMDRQVSGASVWYLDASPATVSVWLVRLRWARVVVDVLVLAAALVLPAGDFPLRQLAPLIAATAIVNADLAWSRRGTPRWLHGVALTLDAVLLTGLLEL